MKCELRPILHCLLLVYCSAEHSHKIWPAAAVEKYTDEPSLILRTIRLSEFDFIYQQEVDQEGLRQVVVSNSNSTDPILESAEERFRKRVSNLVPIDNAADYPVNPKGKVILALIGVRIKLSTGTTMKEEPKRKRKVRNRFKRQYNEYLTISSPPHGVDESYEIEITHVTSGDNNNNYDDDGSFILLNAPTVYGVLRGLSSLTQLIEFAWLEDNYTDERKKDKVATFVIYDTPLTIQDAPVYPYRGLLIDTSRHYLPLPLILHNLDAMEMNKMNVLHWHITDSQSWPYSSVAHPELSKAGAYCDTCVYTPKKVRKVITEASHRGIRVLPEFDLPGHCQSVGKSHPEFLTYCGGKRREPLDVTQESVLDWVYQLYDEVSEVWIDEFIHVGGDEIPMNCWKNSTTVQEWMKRHNMTKTIEVLTFFEIQLLAYVNGNLHKKAVVWQELFDLGVKLPHKHTIVDIWKDWKGYRSAKTRETATKHGFQVILSAGWYLDHLDNDWLSFYQVDPRNFNGTKSQKKLVIGGHASMWGERVDEANFLSRVWPRASATAEKLWAGNLTLPETNVMERIQNFRCYMNRQGVPASPVSPGFCERRSANIEIKNAIGT